MKYKDLPQKHKKVAVQWIIDEWKELYRSEGINAEVTENSPEVQETLEDAEFEILFGEYEKGVRYERLERQ